MIKVVNRSVKILYNISRKKPKLKCIYCSPHSKLGKFNKHFPCSKHLKAKDINDIICDHLKYNYHTPTFKQLLKIHKYNNIEDFFILLDQSLPRDHLDLNIEIVNECVFQNPNILKMIVKSLKAIDIPLILELMKKNYNRKKVNWASELHVNLIYLFSQMPSTKIEFAETIIDSIFGITKKVKFYILNQILSQFWLSRKQLVIDYYTTLVRTFELTNIEKVYEEVLQ